MANDKSPSSFDPPPESLAPDKRLTRIGWVTVAFAAFLPALWLINFVVGIIKASIAGGVDF